MKKQRAAEAAQGGATDDRSLTRENVLAFLAEHGAEAGKRDLVKHFRLKGAERIKLKRLLKEIESEGLIEKRRGRFHQPGHMPSVMLCDITGRDEDGELIAEPVEWDEEHGEAPRIVVAMPAKARPGEPVPGVGDRVLLRIDDKGEGEDSHTGRVIRLIAKKPRQTLGILRVMQDGTARLVPVDKKAQGRELFISKDHIRNATDGDLVAVTVLREGRFARPSARVTERLGSLTSERTISMVAIHAHGLPHIFPDTVLKEAESATPATMRDREDWRDLPLVTIDPADAKDHDDAVHARPDDDPKNKDGHIVTVAIADVAAYVRAGTALDREALIRGNSVYFPDRVVPMLPERLSNDLCSLRPDGDRPALAVRMTLDAHGRKLRHSFHRIMMRSHGKLAYEQAQSAIDGRPDETTGPLLAPVLQPLWRAYETAKKARDQRQPLDLDLPERKLVLKKDGTIDRVIVPQRLEAHRLIEEFMILANVAAAETLERAGMPLIYRVHDEPSLEKMRALGEVLASIGMKLPRTGALKPELFNDILAQVKGTGNAPLVNEIVLRSQAQAEYAAENYGHFGLNLRRYAHFTSPIRRYADLIVHRGLLTTLGAREDGLPKDAPRAQLAEIAASISAAERRAAAAERETVDRLIAHFLADRIGATFEGRIGGVTRAGLFVKLDDTGADGFVPASTLGADFYAYDEQRHALVGRRTGESYRLGDAVTVKLVEAQPVAGALRFEMISEGRRGVALPAGKKRITSAKAETRRPQRARRHGPT
ncbi:ribonuclease R [Terrarubrum flagellatum]|uniref:ribonuclease R n=1 Tax=Terrirubrum flagellatum TaxID=2895980 RepID=UPI0031451F27